MYIDDWITDPQVRAEAYQLLQYHTKYETFDIRDTKLIPTPADRGPDFDERLREATEVDRMIE